MTITAQNTGSDTAYVVTTNQPGDFVLVSWIEAEGLAETPQINMLVLAQEAGADVGSVAALIQSLQGTVQVSWMEADPTVTVAPTDPVTTTVNAVETGSDVGSVSALLRMLASVQAQEVGSDTAEISATMRVTIQVAAQEAGGDVAHVIASQNMPVINVTLSGIEEGSDTAQVLTGTVVQLLEALVMAQEMGSDVATVTTTIRPRTTDPALEVAHYPITSNGKEILAVFERQPGEVKDFDISFADYLFAHADTPRTYDPIELEVPATLQLLERQWMGSRGYLKVWVAGMQDRRSYKITAWLNTEGGRRLEADVMVVVREA